jgi:hypothetical protein
MTTQEKLVQLKALLQITDATQDSVLAVFLSLARDEILSWLYSGKTPEGVTDVPARYEPTQVMACVAGFGLRGLENQTASTENAITRQFKYSNMLEFIRANVVPYAQVM